MLLERVCAVWLRAKALVHRRRLDRDLDEELAFHLAMRTREYGGDPAAPRRPGASSETRPIFARPAASYGRSPLSKRSGRICAMRPARWRKRQCSVL